MRNVEATILSQYANSPTITTLIENMNAYIDPAADIDNFYNCVFDVTSESITTFGLLIWSRIVGIPQSLLQSLSLTNSQLQSLVLLKALSNISLRSAPAINQLLLNWLGAGTRAYVTDLGNMALNYTFEFPLEPYQVSILENSGIFVRPAGVLANIVQGSFPYVGFAEMGQPWVTTMGNGIFYE